LSTVAIIDSAGLEFQFDTKRYH